MRVFLTGATGFTGRRIVSDLIGAGHQVLGLTRSDAGAESLIAAGAEPHRGDIELLDSLRRGAEQSDGVIHTAFDHVFPNLARRVANCEKDRRAVEALGSALAGSDRLLIITSGTGHGRVGHGKPAVEDHYDAENPNPRKASEEAGQALTGRGVNVCMMRLPQVHDTERQGLVTPLVAMAREKSVVGYVGDGLVRWPAAHVDDVACLYRLALEKGEGTRYHAVDEEGVPVKDIVGVIGRGLGVPVRKMSPDEAAETFGWLAPFLGMDLYASSQQTRDRLGWRPSGPGLIADLEAMDYAAPQ